MFSESGLILWIHNVAEPGPEQLQQPQIRTSPMLVQEAPGMMGESLLTLMDQDKSGLTRPADLLQWLQSLIFMPLSNLNPSVLISLSLVVFSRLHSSSVSWSHVETFFLSLWNTVLSSAVALDHRVPPNLFSAYISPSKTMVPLKTFQFQ